MAAETHSFIDIAALDALRGHFAAGDAVVVLSDDLETVIWCNGPGAALLGFSGIEDAIGSDAGLGRAARRQIESIPGFPRNVRSRAVSVRIATGIESQALMLRAASVSLPGGQPALMLVSSAANTASRSAAENAARAMGGFEDAGHYVAMIGPDSEVLAASKGFETIGLDTSKLNRLIEDLADERILKRIVDVSGRSLPVGFARLAEDPARYFLITVDESDQTAELERQPEALAPDDSQGFPRPSPEPITQVESSPAGDESGGTRMTEATPPAAATQTGLADVAHEDEKQSPSQPEARDHDSWYFSEGAKTAKAANDAHGRDEVGTKPERREVSVAVDQDSVPVRFVWRTDAEGRFSTMSPEFTNAVGEETGSVIGEHFVEIAKRLGLDPDGEIAGLLNRRDTWSGRSVLWPVSGTDLRVPVDLAALPAYGRERQFEGFRGFGVVRVADALVDPNASEISSTTQSEEAAPEIESSAANDDPLPEDMPDEEPLTDPFGGEVPVLELAPMPERRFSDKIIRLAEHREAANERTLTPGERNAFREIGEQLKRASTPEAARPTPLRPDAVDNDASEAEYISHVDQTEKNGPSSLDSEANLTAAEVAAEEKAGGTASDELGDRASDAPAPTVQDDLEPATRDEQAEDEPSATVAAEDPKSEPDEAGKYRTDQIEARSDARDESAAGSRSIRDVDSVRRDEEDAIEPKLSEVPTEVEPVLDNAPEATHVPGDGHLDPKQSASDAFEPKKPTVPDLIEPAKPQADTSILAQLPIPVLIHAGDTLHYANDAFFALTGYPSLDDFTEAGGLDALFSGPPEDRGADDSRLLLLTADGQEVFVNAFLRSVPWLGGKALLLTLIRQPDSSSATTKGDHELQARVEDLRTILDTATDGVVLIGNDGNVRSLSRPAEALFGYDSDELVGKPFASLFAIESQRAAGEYLASLSDNGVASVLNDGREVIGHEAQGRFIPLFMTIGRLPGNGGFCAVLRDITQWKRAEEDLTQARAQAERTSTQKSDFLARVSHEIRTPLNAIIGFSELMLDEKFGPVANDRYRDYLRDINRSGNHVLDLVNDLLDISKIEAGQQEMDYEAVALNDTLAETVAMMQPQANRERVIIRSSFASRLPEVVADLRSVRQIALNILSNAVRYTQAGGQVIISTALEPNGEVVMRIRDTGIGMSQSEIEQALKPFKQLHTMKRGRGDGTGLGLPLTKAMVEANRARFGIYSTPGEGTLVEVTFPSTRVLAG
ncbi:MAG: histidine kinase dimerization/phospho-acceptor domain-containing protein [Rhizobiaceae bacterium]